MSTELGSVLRRTLQQKQMSRKELSARTGLSESALSRFISGYRGAKVSLDVMYRLATALDIPLLDFVRRSGFCFQPDSLLSLVDAEEIIGKLIRPTLDRVVQDDELLHNLFLAVQLNLSPTAARERLMAMPVLDQLKLLVANGFDIHVVDAADPAGCVDFRSTPPPRQQLPPPILNSLAEAAASEHQPAMPAPFKPEQFVRVRLTDDSIFDTYSLQACIANIDNMDSEVAEKLVRNIEATAKLFPKKLLPESPGDNL